MLVIFYLSHFSNKGLLKVINYLVEVSHHYTVICPRQQTISKAVDIGVIQVNRIIKLAERIGFITIIHRRNKDNIGTTNPLGIMSNIYTLHPLFQDMNFRNALRHLIPAFKYLPLVVLTITTTITSMSGNSSRSKDVNVNEDYNIYNTKQSINYSRARNKFAQYTQLGNIEPTLKERLIMNDAAVLYENTVFSEAVRKAGKEFQLSCAGMCSISSFNDMIINIVLKRISRYTTTISNPFGLFVSLCNQVSKEMNIPIKHQKAYALAEEFDLQLGKNTAILEGGNQPRNGLQREHTEVGYHRPYHSKATNLGYVPTLETIQAKNPHIPVVGIEALSPGIYRIQHTHDITWRETTADERYIWTERMKEVRDVSHNFFAKFIPIDPPLMFHGNPNVTAFKIYHIDDGIMHEPAQKLVGCCRCDKERKIC